MLVHAQPPCPFQPASLPVPSPCPRAAAGKARDQLALAARVLVFAVHAANAPLLASCGPLTVHGTAAFFEHGVKAKHLDGTTVDVGAPPQARASALPATVGTLTHISVEYRFPK